MVELVLPLYGLDDAPCRWYSKISGWLTDGIVNEGKAWTRSKLDPCLFHLRDDRGQLCGVLVVHVDDVLIAGEGPTFEQAVRRLKAKFPFRKWAVGEGEYCGSALAQDPKTYDITIKQTTPYQELKQVTVRRRVADSEAATDAEIAGLRRLLGQGGWLCSQTRPDTSVQVSQGQQVLPRPTVGQIRRTSALARRLQQHKDMTLRVRSIPPCDLCLIMHSDASFLNAAKNGTQAGYILGFTNRDMARGEQSPWSPAAWRSYRLKRVVGSTLAGETQALSDGIGHLQ